VPGAESQLPGLPSGILPAAGSDPRLFFSDYTATAGQTVTVALNLQVTDPAGLDFRSADLNFAYDPSLLTPANARAGTLDGGYFVLGNTAVPGVVRVEVVTTHHVLAAGSVGSIVLIDFTVNAHARAGRSSPLNLVPQLGGQPTQVDGDPGNVRPYPTFSPHDANIDGRLTVTAPTGAGGVATPTVVARRVSLPAPERVGDNVSDVDVSGNNVTTRPTANLVVIVPGGNVPLNANPLGSRPVKEAIAGFNFDEFWRLYGAADNPSPVAQELPWAADAIAS
jgi:hypothetical protein